MAPYSKNFDINLRRDQSRLGCVPNNDVIQVEKGEESVNKLVILWISISANLCSFLSAFAGVLDGV